MTDYPNREHKNAEKAARRRAADCLEAISVNAASLWERMHKNEALPVYCQDAHILADLAGRLAENLAVLETLREVREWDDADKAARDAQAQNCTSTCDHDAGRHEPRGTHAAAHGRGGSSL